MLLWHQDKPEHHKKTDEPTPDDADASHKHSELDDPNAPSSDNEADAVDEVDDDERERNSDPENSEDAEEVHAPVESTPEPAARKRRARKD